MKEKVQTRMHQKVVDLLNSGEVRTMLEACKIPPSLITRFCLSFEAWRETVLEAPAVAARSMEATQQRLKAFRSAGLAATEVSRAARVAAKTLTTPPSLPGRPTRNVGGCTAHRDTAMKSLLTWWQNLDRAVAHLPEDALEALARVGVDTCVLAQFSSLVNQAEERKAAREKAAEELRAMIASKNRLRKEHLAVYRLLKDRIRHHRIMDEAGRDLVRGVLTPEVAA